MRLTSPCNGLRELGITADELKVDQFLDHIPLQHIKTLSTISVPNFQNNEIMEQVS